MVNRVAKEVNKQQSFYSVGSLFHSLAALNINKRRPYDGLL